MKKKIFNVLFVLLLFSNLLLSQQIIVHDGDTFKMFDDKSNKYITIRIANIDAPELNQPYGIESRKYLNFILLSGKIRIEFLNFDKYHRNICNVFVDNNRIDSMMISNGYAYVYLKYCNYWQLIDYEIKAKNSEINIWSMNSFIYPWEFRKIKNLVPQFKFKIPLM